MRTERLDVQTPDGAPVAVWVSRDPDRDAECVVVLSSGFGQKMRVVGAIAAYFVANGAVVYRFDAADHVGLGGGTVREFCLSRFEDSMEAVIELAEEREQDIDAVRLAAISLSARPSIRRAARHADVERVVLLVGVVDVVATLESVLGTDFYAVAWDDLPETVQIEKQVVDPRAMWRDDDTEDPWGDAAVTAAELASVSAPVVNFVAEGDDWVDVETVRALFDVCPGGSRFVAGLPDGPHAIFSNPVALRDMLRRMTAAVTCDASQLRAAVDGDEALLETVSEPTFEELADLLVRERRLEREQQAAPTRSSG